MATQKRNPHPLPLSRAAGEGNPALRKFIAFLLIALAIIIVWSAGLPDQADVNSFTIKGAGSQRFAVEIGGLAPPVTVTTLDNRPLSLNALDGKVVILNFWATWCAPCIVEMPLLQRVYDKYRADGLQIVAVNASESLSNVQAWQTRFGFTFDLALDSGTVANLYRLRGLPSTYFIGRDGIIKQIVYGPLNDSDLDALLEALLKEQ